MDDLAWMGRGKCTSDPDLFYPEGGRFTNAARAICDTCSVKDTCLQYALDNMKVSPPGVHSPVDVGWFGMWGGTTPDERKRMKNGAPIPMQRNRRSVVAA